MSDDLFDPLPPDLADLEAELSALRPAAPAPDLAERVLVEAVLRSVTPVAPSAEFADRVVAASVRPARSNVLRFVRFGVPLAAAAAVALMVTPAWRGAPVGVEKLAVVEPTYVDAYAEAPVSYAPRFDDDVVHLPVINLPDGRAYRPVVRAIASAPAEFRAMPGGAIMPVSFTRDEGVEYHRVDFE